MSTSTSDPISAASPVTDPDLLFVIFNNFATFDHGDPRYRDLLRFARVSRAWNVAANRYIYRHVIVRGKGEGGMNLESIRVAIARVLTLERHGYPDCPGAELSNSPDLPSVHTVILRPPKSRATASGVRDRGRDINSIIHTLNGCLFSTRLPNVRHLVVQPGFVKHEDTNMASPMMRGNFPKSLKAISFSLGPDLQNGLAAAFVMLRIIPKTATVRYILDMPVPPSLPRLPTRADIEQIAKLVLSTVSTSVPTRAIDETTELRQVQLAWCLFPRTITREERSSDGLLIDLARELERLWAIRLDSAQFSSDESRAWAADWASHVVFVCPEPDLLETEPLLAKWW